MEGTMAYRVGTIPLFIDLLQLVQLCSTPSMTAKLSVMVY